MSSLLIKMNFILSLFLVGCGIGTNTSSNNSTSWAWMNGSNQVNESGTYGTKGTPSSLNIPGGRFIAVSWVDESGNFWLFGGAENLTPPITALNDLWKYTPSTNQWTWMNGSSQVNESGIYGTIGIADANNTPGARFGSVSWIDSQNNLWMFGGYGFAESITAGSLNDLWKYNITNNQWTWVGGSNSINESGSYGTKGVTNSLNSPGARLGQIGWTDESGNLWMFGGAQDLATLYLFNDLWKYNPTTGFWTWMSGSESLNATGVYGIQQTSSALNVPGSRIDAISWVDNSGNLWLFGGDGVDGLNTSPHQLLNDLWQYNITTGMWTWMNGAISGGAYGIYGTIGIGTPNTVPGAREHRVPISWVDNTGNLLMFGGDGNGASTSGILNDLWQYNPNTNIWTWISGSNESNAYGSYGTLLNQSTSNYPGARMDAVGWIDSSGTLWMFGGSGNAESANGLLNDMWRY